MLAAPLEGHTEWENPFMAGELGRMDYFSVDGDSS
jgi:hypothetical protein